MKKTFAVVFALVIFLCGCGEKEEITPQTKNIAFVADITYYNESYSLKTKVDSKGNMQATVVTPTDFGSLVFNFKGDKVTAEFMGLTYTPQTGSLPVNNVAKIIYDAISDVSSDSEIAVKEGKNCVVKGEIEGRKYEFTFSPSGLPLTLELPDDGYKARFNDLTVL